MQNVEDFVKRIRNHPSIGLYCGRNEGNPPAVVDSAIRKLLPLEHPGLHYISNSASGVVSGGGPYRMMPVKFYFERRATEKLHSEIGMPSIVSMQSLRRMLPDSSMWPMGDAWGLHDFCLEGAQGAAAYIKQMEDSFGRVDSLNDWLLLSQWLDYNGYRAMFEAQSRHRMGLLLWMSHSAWPSLVWQTYDYYFEPAAAYFACKKACEPLHIQWNAASDSIEVVNYSAPVESVLSATLELLNADGSVVSTQTAETRCPEDTAVRCFKVQYPAGLTSVYFMRLRLNRGGTVVSENLYWRGIEEGNLKALRSMAKTTVSLDTQPERQGSKWIMTTLLRNAGNVPALMVRLSVLGEKSKQTILPVIFSDNFILLMPGEQRTIRMELDNADTMGEIPVVALEGLNVK